MSRRACSQLVCQARLQPKTSATTVRPREPMPPAAMLRDTIVPSNILCGTAELNARRQVPGTRRAAPVSSTGTSTIPTHAGTAPANRTHTMPAAACRCRGRLTTLSKPAFVRGFAEAGELGSSAAREAKLARRLRYEDAATTGLNASPVRTRDTVHKLSALLWSHNRAEAKRLPRWNRCISRLIARSQPNRIDR